MERSPHAPRPPPLILTTQPGWAIATLAELRGLGVQERAELWHRDSTLVLPAATELRGKGTRELLTVAEAYDGLAVATPRGQWDATRVLAQQVRELDLRAALGRHNRGARGRGRGPQTLYVVVSEVWGDTQLRRRELADAVRHAIRAAFPDWREPRDAPPGSGGPSRAGRAGGERGAGAGRRGSGLRIASGTGAEGGRPAPVRLLCKSDARTAVLGVQRYSRVGPEDESRPGALREHLACGLLALAGARSGDAVLDPFMGTGTILRAAADHFEVGACLGAEVDRASFRLAQQRVEGAAMAREARAEAELEVDLLHGAFGALDAERVPDGVRVASNLPFGVRFEAVETERLVRFLTTVGRKAAGMALLLGREQAAVVGEALGLRVKHVIVLGQPAAIAHGRPEAPARRGGRRPVGARPTRG